MIFTIGHSNRSWDEFLSILKHYDISFLADIRRFPGSRLWPQFNKNFLEKELANHNIKYLHIEKLGGRRNGKRSDGNTVHESMEKPIIIMLGKTKALEHMQIICALINSERVLKICFLLRSRKMAMKRNTTII